MVSKFDSSKPQFKATFHAPATVAALARDATARSASTHADEIMRRSLGKRLVEHAGGRRDIIAQKIWSREPPSH